MASKVVVGPVLGKVSARTARVLLEVDRGAEVTCTLVPTHGRSRRRLKTTLQLEGGRPRVFEIRRLRPETEYAIEIEGARCDVEGRVRTYADAPTRMNVGAVSCNFTVRRKKTDLWEVLRDRYARPGDLDLLLHLGDQVYGDNAFEGAIVQLAQGRRRTASLEREILDSYRQLYRYAWGHGPTREAMALVPSLSIWDDHEIRDDWGSQPADSDPDSDERFVGRLARRVYREYQRQLWDDVDPDSDPDDGAEFHAHAWGPIGVLFVDQRGARSFDRDPGRPYLGASQWQWITEVLADGGLLGGVRALMVATSVPLAYVGHTLSTHGSHFVDDLIDHWAYADHRKEQLEMVRALRRWKERGGRELLVLGGDVHVGGHTTIEHHGRPAFQQLITSPVTNNPPSWLQFAGLRVALEMGERLSETYSFEHREFTRKRNFGVVVVRVPADGDAPPKVEGSLVTEP